MNTDKIALKLNGDVPIEDYAKVLDHFSRLIHALSSEIVGGKDIAWKISNLGYGSANTEIQGIAEKNEDVYRVTSAYYVVGAAVARREPIPYSAKVVAEVNGITSVINGHVKSIDFVSGDRVATIDFTPSQQTQPSKYYSMGSITGRVDTLSRRKNMFVLYDELFDKPVDCFLSDEKDDLMRGVWGKLATVIGEIEREPQTGIALRVRNVLNVIVEEEVPAGAFEAARGILTHRASTASVNEINNLFYG